MSQYVMMTCWLLKPRTHILLLGVGKRIFYKIPVTSRLTFPLKQARDDIIL